MVSTLNLPFPFANDFFHSRFAVAFLPAAIFSGPKLPSSQQATKPSVTVFNSFHLPAGREFSHGLATC